MSHRLKIGLIVATLVAVAVFAAFWVTVELSQSQLQIRRIPPPGGFAGDFEYFYFAITIISTINIALLVILLLNYVNVYYETHSTFTIGLIIMATAFLIRDVSSSPFVVGLFSFRPFGLGPFVFLPSIFETAALSVLLYLSVRY